MRADHTLERAVRISHAALELRGAAASGPRWALSAASVSTAAIYVDEGGKLGLHQLVLVGARHGFVVARLSTVRTEHCLFLGNSVGLGLQQRRRDGAPSAVNFGAGAVAALLGSGATASLAQLGMHRSWPLPSQSRAAMAALGLAMLGPSLFSQTLADHGSECAAGTDPLRCTVGTERPADRGNPNNLTAFETLDDCGAPGVADSSAVNFQPADDFVRLDNDYLQEDENCRGAAIDAVGVFLQVKAPTVPVMARFRGVARL
eukprot:SAG11_NODE_42_length_20827_cov_9.289801_12_plen_261_part_00